MFMTYTAPNSKTPDLVPGYCVYPFQTNPVCTPPNTTANVANPTGSMPAFNTARSYHSGGVNALFSDGSVKFIKDSINRNTWWSLGTRARGEIISADSY